MIGVVVGSLAAAGVCAVAVIFERRYARLRRRHREVIARLEAVEASADRAVRTAYAEAARGLLAAAGRGPALPLELTSQFGEEAFIWELLGRPLTGTYVEVGAFDGYSLSPTYFLEAIGWRGVLVEPIAERAAECARRRPGSRVVCAAVGATGSVGTARFEIAEGGAGQGVAAMASSLTLGAGQRAFIDRMGARTRSVEVRLTTLAACVDEACAAGALGGRDTGSVLDLAVIDVEGSERDALDGLELARLRPRTLLVEDLSLGGDRGAAELLEAAGYEHICWLGHNRVAVRRDEPGLVERARRLAAGARGMGETAGSPMAGSPVPLSRGG